MLFRSIHESGHFIELLMDVDYKNYCDDHNSGDYNNADNNNDGDNNDDDDSDSDSDDDDSNDDSDEDFYQLVAVTCNISISTLIRLLVMILNKQGGLG